MSDKIFALAAALENGNEEVAKALFLEIMERGPSETRRNFSAGAYAANPAAYVMAAVYCLKRLLNVHDTDYGSIRQRCAEFFEIISPQSDIKRHGTILSFLLDAAENGLAEGAFSPTLVRLVDDARIQALLSKDQTAIERVGALYAGLTAKGAGPDETPRSALDFAQTAVEFSRHMQNPTLAVTKVGLILDDAADRIKARAEADGCAVPLVVNEIRCTRETLCGLRPVQAVARPN